LKREIDLKDDVGWVILREQPESIPVPVWLRMSCEPSGVPEITIGVNLNFIACS
jgi:hypothetical protein